MQNLIRRFGLVCSGFFFLAFAVAACWWKGLPSGAPEASDGDIRIRVTERYGNSLRGEMDGIAVLVLRGTDEQMGEAHGVLAGGEILTILDQVLIPYINRKKPNAWDKAMLPLAKSFELPDPYDKELASILRGITKAHPNGQDRVLASVGREITFDDLRTLNCLSDIFDWAGGGCSSFSAWGPLTGDGGVISGRNLDYRTFPGKIPIMILARAPSEKGRQATVEIGGPGYIGMTTAMNEDGVLAMMHNAGGLPAVPQGRSIPRTLIVREALEKIQASDSIEKIATVFKNQPVRIGNNTHIALPVQMASAPFVIEWDGNSLEDGATLRLPDPAAGRNALVCTNHFLKRGESGKPSGSQRRFELLSNPIRKFYTTKAKIDFQKAVKMMHTVARRGETVTYLTVVAFPEARKMVFAVTPARGVPATEGKWAQVAWNSLFGLE